MSDKLNDAEFWLPSEFLTEEDIVLDSYGVLGSSRPNLALEFSNKHGSFSSSTGSGSGSTSPVESSTETVSEEEGDSLGSELTQLLTLLRGNRLSSSSQNHEKQSFGLTGSGLSKLKSGSGRFVVPTNGNPNGSFQASAHSTAPGSANEDAWDLIYRAASQVAKNNGGFGFGFGSAFPQNPNPQRLLNPQNSSLYFNQEKNRLNFEDTYMKRAGGSDLFTAGAGGFNSFSNARPPVDIGLKNHQLLLPDLAANSGYGFVPGYGSGPGPAGIVKAGAVKSERVGTGVFLPRRYGAGTGDDSSGNAGRPNRWKKLGGYGSVGGLQANNNGNPALNNPSGDTYLQSQQPRFMNGGVANVNDASAVAQRAAMLTLQRTFPEGGAINHDVCLPQEWTY